MNEKCVITYVDGKQVEVKISGNIVAKNSFKNRRNILKVKLQDGIEVIDNMAFARCTNLENMELPATIETIGKQAFQDCKSLKNIKLPSNIKKIGGSAFSGCDSLLDFVVPHSLKTIPEEFLRNCRQLRSVVMHSGISEIKEYAFADCGEIENIGIAETVKVIREGAFYNCSELEEIRLPENMHVIERLVFASSGLVRYIAGPNMEIISEEAFSDCKRLETVDLSQVACLENYAFSDCTALKKVVIPMSMYELGEGVFDNISGLTIECERQDIGVKWNENWCGNGAKDDVKIIWGKTSKDDDVEDEVEYTNKIKEDGYVLYQGGHIKKLAYGIKIISDSVINDNSKIVEVVLPSSTLHIGDKAFSACHNLKSVVIYEGCKTIGDYSFFNCFELKELRLPKTISKIGEHTFAGCGLSEIELTVNIKSIGEGAFEDFDNLTVYCEYPFKPTGWHDDWCDPIAEINWKDKLSDNASGLDLSKVTLDHANFEKKEFDENIIYDDKFHAKYKKNAKPTILYTDLTESYIDNESGTTAMIDFERDDILSIELPKKVVIINSEAFLNKKHLERIVLSRDLMSICSGAFDGCTALESISFPKKVKELGSRAFKDCHELSSVCLNKGLEIIEDFAFENCTSIEKIFIPSSVEHIGLGIFSGCDNLNVIEVDSKNERYYSEGNCIIERVTKTIIAGCEKSVIPPDGQVLTIGEYSFYKNSSLGNVEIPNGVRKIESHAFSGCKNMVEAIIANSVREIESCVFSECSDLEKVKIPARLDKMGNKVFFNCGKLYDIELGREIKFMGSNVFSGCHSLPYLRLPEGVLRIENSEYENMDSLKYVVIPSTVTLIGRFAFKNCENLAYVLVNKNTRKIMKNAFEGCYKLEIKCGSSEECEGFEALWNIEECDVEYGYDRNFLEEYEQENK